MVASAFDQIDASFTAPHEGGKTRNDGTGHTAAYGIDQNAHPEIDVLALTPEQARAIRKREYWDAINGDHLAQIDPKLAAVAYDTAIMSGVGTTARMLRQSNGDPNALLRLRVDHQQSLLQSNPEKYGGAAQSWMNRNRDLAKVVGGGLPETPVALSTPEPMEPAPVAPSTTGPMETAPAAPGPAPISTAPTPAAPASPLTPAPPASALTPPTLAPPLPTTREMYGQLLSRGQPA